MKEEKIMDLYDEITFQVELSLTSIRVQKDLLDKYIELKRKMDRIADSLPTMNKQQRHIYEDVKLQIKVLKNSIAVQEEIHSFHCKWRDKLKAGNSSVDKASPTIPISFKQFLEEREKGVKQRIETFIFNKKTTLINDMERLLEQEKNNTTRTTLRNILLQIKDTGPLEEAIVNELLKK